MNFIRLKYQKKLKEIRKKESLALKKEIFATLEQLEQNKLEQEGIIKKVSCINEATPRKLSFSIGERFSEKECEDSDA